jgi:hypothetical protein
MQYILTSSLDLFSVAGLEHKVKGLPIPAEPKLDGWRYIWFPGGDGRQNPKTYIKVPIIHFEPPDFQPCREIVSAGYYYKDYYIVQDTFQAISPGSIPSLETLLQAYLSSRRNFYSQPSPFGGLYKAFRDFAERYCSMAAALPLVSSFI